MLAVASLSLPVCAQDDAARVEARAHFDRGVTLTKALDYDAALREFELAYAAVPHYSVLYNIGQAQVALGRSAEATTSLQRYLDEGGAAIDPKRRAEVEETVSRLRPSQNEPAPPAPPVAPAEPTKAEAPPVDLSVKTEPSAPFGGVPVAPATRAEPPRSSTPRTVAYLLGGASIALGGAALGHYFWNRARYDDWRGHYRDYTHSPSDEQRRELNDLSRSITSASIVTVALTVGASVTLGAGAVLFVSSGPSTSASRTDVTESTLGVRGAF